MAALRLNCNDDQSSNEELWSSVSLVQSCRPPSLRILTGTKLLLISGLPKTFDGTKHIIREVSSYMIP